MSLFSDLNRANKILKGINESVDVNEAKEAKKDECDKVKAKNEDDEEDKDGKDDEDDKDGKDEDEDAVDEALQALFDVGYSLVESNITYYLCEDCCSIHENDGFCEDCGGDLTEAIKLVVKNGKVVKKKVKNKKAKMSAKQKQALKKAQKASQKSGAKKARAKSMKVRAKKGLDEGFEEFECPKCGYIGDMEEIEKGVFVCPECGVELEIDDLEVDEQVDEALEIYKKALDIPAFILNEGDDFVKKYITTVFGINFDEE